LAPARLRPGCRKITLRMARPSRSAIPIRCR
jgi:hypothetical protein